MKHKLMSIACGILLLSGGFAYGQDEAHGHRLPPPLQVVAEFLNLTDGQIEELVVLHEMLVSTVRPLKHEIHGLKAPLAEELNSDSPSPEVVGRLVIEIHSLKKLIQQAHKSYLEDFVSLLVPEQVEKFKAVQLAARLQNVLPAFKKLALIGPVGRHRPPHRRPIRDAIPDDGVEVDVDVDVDNMPDPDVGGFIEIFR